MNKKYLIFSLLLLNFLLISIKFTFAVDYFLENNGEIDVAIAKDEINRIKISNDRIKNLKANENELKIEAEKNGEIYVKPLYGKDAVTLFITTENNNTYKLNLKSKAIKSQQIFINKKNFTLDNYIQAENIHREKPTLTNDDLYFEFNDDFKISVINLLRAMSYGVELKTFDIVHRNNIELLNYGKNLKVYWLYSYIKTDNFGIAGEIIKIKNINKDKIELREEIFFRKGIRAVKLEKFELKPKESCYVYLVGGWK